MSCADECVIYDSCQYTKNDWRNRNRLKINDDLQWLTIPVQTSGRFGQSIYDVRISETQWCRRHISLIDQALGKAPYISTIRDVLIPTLERCAELTFLHDVNMALIRSCLSVGGIQTRVSLDSDYELDGESPTERVVSLVAQAGGSRYITGPAGLNYLDLTVFREKGIKVDVIDYESLRPYRQLGGDFEPGVSVLDYFANVEQSAHDFKAIVHPVSSES
jgi:hypothetical protein